MPQHQIAKQFNVSQSTISNIENGRLWKHLTHGLSIKNRINIGSSKLTTDDLTEIRLLIKKQVSSKEIAKLFNVHIVTIDRIKKHQTHKER
jgi:IS30 family transposase